MHYCGFFIQLRRHKIYDEVPIRMMDDVENTLSVRRRGPKQDSREALTTSSVLSVYIYEHRIVDQAFLFELRTILEEFIAKRLGDHKSGKALNCGSSG